MQVAFDESFYKRLVKIKDKALLEKVKEVILAAEQAEGIQQIPHIKKLAGFKTFYRVRIGDYRVGLEVKKDVLWFITIANRKDIYKNFP